ncbi:hypothetical protein GCM10010399_44160 [Dactylosporangium fulvum]|uniref:Uncharacterized protein n=1 Tax=Dactylosporangium fulvum TaxID=53359 RepID=A0ABY5W8N2_9ACTN|nr:hypothetical protein [Dactylosporangium fulvum]UWP85917.1 hypothetical protein Dfulv_17360 [Dactylosporangium fulvum]
MTTTLTPAAAFNETATRRWLDTLHARSTGHVWVGSTHDFRGRTFDTRGRNWAGHATDYIAQLDRTGAAGIYVRTTTLRSRPSEGRGHDDDSLALPGLAADLDIAGPGHKTPKPLPADPAAAKHVIDETGLLDPSVWVHSGGGLYAWWLLDEPYTINGDTSRVQAFSARWQDVIRRTSERLGYTYGPVGDLARILRIPGTVNRKKGMPEPAPCRIVHDSGRRYSIANLRDNLREAWAALPPDAPIAIRRAPSQRPAGRDDVVEDFERTIEWDDALLLGGDGWTLHRQRGAYCEWVRPGKERREGISATTGRSPDRDRMWVFTDATLFPQGESITKFHAYALLHHGGDHSAAYRELRRLGYGQRVAAA